MARLPDSLTFLRVSGACAAHAALSRATDTSSGVSDRLMGDSLCVGGRRTGGVSIVGCATAGTVSRPFSPSKRGFPKASRPHDPLLEWRVLSRRRMRRPAFVFLLLAALLGGFSLPVAAAARPETVEVKGAAGSVGRLPRVQVDDGGSYVAADKLTALLKGSWSASGPRATLTVGKRSAQFVRDQPRVVDPGPGRSPSTPPPRVASGSWLVSRRLPRQGPAEARARASPRSVEAQEARVGEAGAGRGPLEELRYRSYPIVHAHRRRDRRRGWPTRWSRADEEVRVRLPRPRARRRAGGGDRRRAREGGRASSRSGADARAARRAGRAGGRGQATALQDPFRLVLDVYRPEESDRARRPGQRGDRSRSRLIVLDAGPRRPRSRAPWGRAASRRRTWSST